MGADIIQSNDNVVAISKPETAINTASAALTNSDSTASFNAMKSADKCTSTLPDCTISFDEHPTAKALAPDAKPAPDAASASGASDQAPQEDGTGSMPKLFSDLTTNDPKKAEVAASNYINAIFEGATPQTFAQLKEGFHQAHGNLNQEEEALGMITPASPAVMHAIGSILDKK